MEGKGCQYSDMERELSEISEKNPGRETSSSGKLPPLQSVFSYFKLARQNTSKYKTGRKPHDGWGKHLMDFVSLTSGFRELI